MMVFGILCVLLWGLIPLVSVLGLTDLDHFQYLFWSSLISFITLLSLSTLSKQTRIFTTLTLSQWAYFGLLGILGTFFYYLCLYQGYQYGNKVDVLSVQYTWPAWIVIFSLLINRETMKWHHILIIATGITSVLLVISKGKLSDLHIPHPNVLFWVLIGAAAFAGFSVLSSKVTIATLPLNSLFFGIASLTSLVSMLVFSEFKFPNATQLYPILINGIFINGISYYFWIKALNTTKAEYLSLLTFTTPLVSVIYLIVFMHEAFIPAYLLAFTLVFVSGVISVHQSRQLSAKNT